MKLNENNLRLLQIGAISFALGQMHQKEITSLVNHLLNEGVYIDEFLEFIHPYSATDCSASFKKILNYFGIIVPDSERAMWYMIKYYLEEIISGSDDPLILLSNLLNNYSLQEASHEGYGGRIYIPHYTSVLDEDKYDEFMGGDYGIHKLYGLHYEDVNRLDDFFLYFHKSREASEINKDIIAEAKKWLEKYGEKYQLDDLLVNT